MTKKLLAVLALAAACSDVKEPMHISTLNFDRSRFTLNAYVRSISNDLDVPIVVSTTPVVAGQNVESYKRSCLVMPRETRPIASCMELDGLRHLYANDLGIDYLMIESRDVQGKHYAGYAQKFDIGVLDQYIAEWIIEDLEKMYVGRQI